MHLVFVSSLLPPARPVSGFDIANRVILDAVREQGARVSMLGYKLPSVSLAEADETVVLGEQEVTTARVSAATKLRWLAAAMRHGTTFSSAKMLACGRSALLHSIDRLAPFDGVILNSVQLPGAFAGDFASYRSIFVAHNIEARSAAENARHAGNPFETLLFRREARLLDRIERDLCRQARFLWTLSQEDRQFLAGDDRTRSAVLPLVTGTEPPPPLEPGRTIAHDFGLIGSWSWRPNRIGLDWFLGEVVPKLPETATIAIAGALAGPQPAIAHPGVRFLGRVPDAPAFLRSCAVIPLASTAGTGVQLKTIEAFEHGLPTVATQTAVRGIGSIPKNCTIADDPAKFAAALVSNLHATQEKNGGLVDGGEFYRKQKEALIKAIDMGITSIAEN